MFSFLYTHMKCCKKPKISQKGISPTALLLTGVFIGGVYGMLFTKTSGKELREKLKKSETPSLDLLKAGIDMDMSFLDFVLQKTKTYLGKK